MSSDETTMQVVVSTIHTVAALPFVTMKIRLQTQHALPAIRKGLEQPYDGWIDMCKRLPSRYGWWYLWRSNLVCIALRGPTYLFASIFGTFVQGRLQESSLGRTDQGRDTAGMIGEFAYGAASVLSFYPAEHYRTRVSMDPSWSFSTALHSPRGFLSLYDGLLPHIISVATRRISNLPFVINPQQRPRYWQRVLSSLLALAISYPFEVVSHRLQLQSSDTIGEQVYSGMIDCFTKMVRTEGWASLYHGFLFTLPAILLPAAPAHF